VLAALRRCRLPTGQRRCVRVCAQTFSRRCASVQNALPAERQETLPHAVPQDPNRYQPSANPGRRDTGLRAKQYACLKKRTRFDPRHADAQGIRACAPANIYAQRHCRLTVTASSNCSIAADRSANALDPPLRIGITCRLFCTCGCKQGLALTLKPSQYRVYHSFAMASLGGRRSHGLVDTA